LRENGEWQQIKRKIGGEDEKLREWDMWKIGKDLDRCDRYDR
jgi:hypothetical protein